MNLKLVFGLVLFFIGFMGIVFNFFYFAVLMIKMMKYSAIMNNPMKGTDYKIKDYVLVDKDKLTTEQVEILETCGAYELMRLSKKVIRCFAYIFFFFILGAIGMHI